MVESIIMKIHQSCKSNSFLTWRLDIDEKGLHLKSYLTKYFKYLAILVIVSQLFEMAFESYSPHNVSEVRQAAKLMDHIMSLGASGFLLLISIGLFPLGKVSTKYSEIRDIGSENGLLIIQRTDGINVSYAGDNTQIEAAIQTARENKA